MRAMLQGSSIDQILEEQGERYLPLVEHILRRSTPGAALSGNSNGRTRELRRAIAARNAFLFRELKKVLEAFEKEGIETILLKGAMMEGIYPAGLRPFCDIDLLIHRRKLPRAMDVLAGLGYRSRGRGLCHGEEDLYSAVAPVKSGRILTQIDLHWLLGPAYSFEGRVNAKGLWQRAREAEIAGLRALVLSPEDALLHSCLHLFKHRRVDWLASACDIAELTHHYEGELDWQAFLKRVRQLRLALPVGYSLERSAALFDLAVPGFVLDAVRSPRSSRLERSLFDSLTSLDDKHGGEQMDASESPLLWLLSVLRAMPNLRYLWNLLVPSREYMLMRYSVGNARLVSFYYLVRVKEAFFAALRGLPVLARGAKGG